MQFQPPHQGHLQSHSLLCEVWGMWDVPWLGVRRLVLALPLTSLCDFGQISLLYPTSLSIKVGPFQFWFHQGHESHLLYSLSCTEHCLAQALVCWLLIIKP